MGSARRTLMMGMVIALAVAAVACSGEVDDPVVADAGDAGSAAPGGSPVAVVGIITDQILAALAGADFELADEGQRLSVGDRVRSDDTGFAEITYHDGSWQRIDTNATLTIVELAVLEAAQTVRTDIDIGRSFNHVRQLVEPEDLYELDTPVATASVRGTIFATDCPTSEACTFTAVEGTILITPRVGEPFLLTAPATVTVNSGVQAPAPTLLSAEEVRADPWVATNLALDGADDGEAAPDDALPDGEESQVPLEQLEALEGLWELAVVDARVNHATGRYEGRPLVMISDETVELADVGWWLRVTLEPVGVWELDCAFAAQRGECDLRPVDATPAFIPGYTLGGEGTELIVKPSGSSSPVGTPFDGACDQPEVPERGVVHIDGPETWRFVNLVWGGTGDQDNLDDACANVYQFVYEVIATPVPAVIGGA